MKVDGVPRCPTVSHGAVQSRSSKILLAAFGDPNWIVLA